MAHISVVVPVFRAEACLYELYARLKISLETITSDFSILLVEDCGGDNSWPLIVELAQRDPRVMGIQFSRNFGQHYGITAGLDVCDADWVVVMDCDLQDRPEEIPVLYAKAREGYEVVVARRGKRQDPIFNRLRSRLFYACFSYLADMDYDSQAGNFRIISRKVVNSIRTMREQLRFFGGLVSWTGFATASVAVQHDPRFAGETSYTSRKLWKLAVETILAHSDKPLRLSIRFGFMISGLAFSYGSYIIYRALAFGTPIAGWSSLIASLYFLGGIIIAILGILGVYLGKTFDEVKRRPLYIVSRTTADGGH
ncbi:MAG TPA: glycosyltransferase family 2 protein [Rhodoferax sp.]|jgi:dolichol-phosphate mannosyltransferase|nr:glycosyltransferase family 2 protein [Rhodoferax sp.]HNV58362.1 glycosyltransferase family 2 protein [Rhodoferax sp.]HPW28059.1 glycosyltransferase family 2 protein [Rhodoferax sp.]